MEVRKRRVWSKKDQRDFEVRDLEARNKGLDEALERCDRRDESDDNEDSNTGGSRVAENKEDADDDGTRMWMLVQMALMPGPMAPAAVQTAHLLTALLSLRSILSLCPVILLVSALTLSTHILFHPHILRSSRPSRLKLTALRRS
jgi:hypothetical protein